MPLSITLLLYLVTGSCLLGTTHGHGKCPDGKDWNEARNICWRESDNEQTFLQGIRTCIADDFHDGPGGNLMPVGELRKLKNRYARHGHRHLEAHFKHENGPFLVNGVKTPCGEWREYPSGRLISFHHFPHFHVQKGKPGDTLLWDPEKNELLVADSHDQHRVLCYRPTLLDDCENCPGYEQGRECNEAGDCDEGICRCDRGFSGSMCQNMDPHDVELLIIGNPISDQAGSNTLLYNFKTNTTCVVEKIPGDPIFTGAAAYFNGKAHFCNTNTTHCYVYDPKAGLWPASADLDSRRIFGGFVLVPADDSQPTSPQPSALNYDWPRFYNWWGTGGGIPDSSNQLGGSITATTELYSYGEWNGAEFEPCDTDILLPAGIALAGQCAVQINAYETAIIGGTNVNGTINNYIMIYNWLDHAWRIESPVPIANVSYESCGLIKDPSTGRYNVLVAGGMITSVTGQTSPSTSSWLWDPMTGNIQIRPDLVPSGAFPELLSLTDYQDLMVNSNGIFSFTVEGGWKQLYAFPSVYYDPVTMLVPKGLFRCL